MTSNSFWVKNGEPGQWEALSCAINFQLQSLPITASLHLLSVSCIHVITSAVTFTENLCSWDHSEKGWVEYSSEDKKKQVKESRVCHNQSQHTQLICPCHLFHASLLETLSAPNVRKHCVPSRDELLPLCVCSLAGLRASTHAISFLEGLFSTPSGPSFSHIQTLFLKKIMFLFQREQNLCQILKYDVHM